MLPLELIVAPTDFSDESLITLRAVSDIVRDFNGELYAQSGMEQASTAAEPEASSAKSAASIPSSSPRAWARAEAQLDDIIRAQEEDGWPIQTVIDVGDTVEHTVWLARCLGADLSVLASRGRRGFQREVSSSVTHRATLSSLTPVFIVQLHRPVTA
jgi:nucleotide-binding universal stress UspA family protein